MAIVNPFPAVRRFGFVLRLLFRSEIRNWFLAMFGILIALMFAQNLLNRFNGRILGEVMNSLEKQNVELFSFNISRLMGVFGVLTLAGVAYRFTEERLGVLWRRWMSGTLLEGYLRNRTYLRLLGRPEIDNPDQRVTEDVKTFTTTALSLTLLLLTAFINLVSFTQVLWQITPFLVLAAVAYALCGTVLTGLVGGKLIGLNFKQFQKEADLRYELIRFRESAELVALQRDEDREAPRLIRRLDDAIENQKHIIAVNRNLGYFTIYYDYLAPFVPIFVVAPFYFRGQIEFGTIAESQFAFAFVLNAISIFIKEFPRLTQLAAVSARLGEVWTAIESPPAKTPISIREDVNHIAFEHLTLTTPKEGLVLIEDLTLEIPRGRRLLMVGPAGAGKSELTRAVAGIWDSGVGTVVRPPLDQILFLSSRPYLLPGTFRSQLTIGLSPTMTANLKINEVIRAVGLAPVVERVGGLEADRDWAAILSTGEQQMVAFARLLLLNPPFAILNEATNSLDRATEEALYTKLSQTDITYVTMEIDRQLIGFHDVVLQLNPDGKWRFGEARENSEQWIG